MENLKLLSPSELGILSLRRTLKEQITTLEHKQSQEERDRSFEMAA